MKIESSNSNALAALQNDSLRVKKSDAAGAVGSVQQTSGANASSSKVNLSSVSALQAAAGLDIDTAKVESIKAALRDGSYKIDSGKIADGVLSHARDLLQSKGV